VRTQCRPLICETDEDCPYFPNQRLVDGELETFTEEFECRNGVCQSADLEAHPEAQLYSYEAELLCLASLPRAEVYDGPDPCPAGSSGEGLCALPLPDPCLQP
jgi:hypothetical protein